MHVLTLAVAAKGDLSEEGVLETKNLLALSTWITSARKEESAEISALRTALMGADETENESADYVDEQMTKMVRTIASLSLQVPLSRASRKWLNEVIGVFSTLLAQCVYSK